MYVQGIMNDNDSYQSHRQLRRHAHEIAAQRQDAQTSSVALTDGFDAPTTEAPTDWNPIGIDGVEGRDYEVTIGSYNNYVNEMERMLSEQAEIDVNQGPIYYRDRETGMGIPSGRDSGSGKHSSRQSPVYNEAESIMEVTGRRAPVELVEHRIVEDGPERTITLWREQVADSAGADDHSDGMGPMTRSPINPRPPSIDSRAGHFVTDRTLGRSSSSGSPVYGKGASKGSGSGGYDRTEYIISYHKPPHQKTSTRHTDNQWLQPPTSPSIRRGSNASLKPSLPRSGSTDKKGSRHSYERAEQYMTSYLHTPPHSQGSERSSSKRNVPYHFQNQPLSPGQTRTYIPVDAAPTGGSVTKVSAVATSTVDLILASCEPSLSHIAPALSDLGVFKVEHLRAMVRMKEETRNRELRGPALSRGVTLMEWAILLDKLHSL